jgi:hypothetical protein
MALKASTGLRNNMLTVGSLKSALDGGFIKIYAGTAIPSDADAAIGSAPLLCTISVNGDGVTGLSLSSTPSGGSIAKAAEVWQGTNVAGGTASFWRFIKTGDTEAASTTDVRLQGNAATSGSELVMTSIVLSFGATQTIDFFTVALPA